MEEELEIGVVEWDAKKYADLVAAEGKLREEMHEVSGRIRDITDSDAKPDEVKDRAYLRHCSRHQALERDIRVHREEMRMMLEMRPKATATREISAYERWCRKGSQELSAEERTEHVAMGRLQHASLPKQAGSFTAGDLQGVRIKGNPRDVEWFVERMPTALEARMSAAQARDIRTSCVRT